MKNVDPAYYIEREIVLSRSTVRFSFFQRTPLHPRIQKYVDDSELVGSPSHGESVSWEDFGLSPERALAPSIPIGEPTRPGSVFLLLVRPQPGRSEPLVDRTVIENLGNLASPGDRPSNGGRAADTPCEGVARDGMIDREGRRAALPKSCRIARFRVGPRTSPSARSRPCPRQFRVHPCPG